MSHDFIDTFRYLYPNHRIYSFWFPIGNNRVKNSGSRIDYFVISKSFLPMIADSTVHNEYFGSDHCPV